MTKKKQYAVMALIAYPVILGLTLYWYDYRLFIILILFGLAMNLERKGEVL